MSEHGCIWWNQANCKSIRDYRSVYGSSICSICAVIIMVTNITAIPAAIVTIVKSAFTGSALTGGAVGSMIVAMQKGVARGIFSNESGLGSAPIAAAAAQTKNLHDRDCVNDRYIY